MKKAGKHARLTSDTKEHVKTREDTWKSEVQAKQGGRRPKKTVKGIPRAFKGVRPTSDTLLTPWAVNDTSKHVEKRGRRAGRGRGDGGLKATHGRREPMTKITYLITTLPCAMSFNIIGRGLCPCFAMGEGLALHQRWRAPLFIQCSVRSPPSVDRSVQMTACLYSVLKIGRAHV